MFLCEMCLGSDGPNGPSLSEVAQGFGLIPIDSEGEAAGVVSEVASEEKMRKRCRQQRHDQCTARTRHTTGIWLGMRFNSPKCFIGDTDVFSESGWAGQKFV